MRARALAAILTALAVCGAALVPPPAPALAEPADGCDPLDPAACLLPFPNDWFTVRDTTTATGRRVNLRSMPRSSLGASIKPDAWNRNDGFSPGSMLLAHVPDVDLARSGAAPITDIGSSLRRDAPIVVIDTQTGERWPYWAETDANATRPDRRALIVRPARNFREGHRYVVALRGLRDSKGAVIQRNPTFGKVLGPALPSSDPLHDRQLATRKVVDDLKRHGVGAEGLQLAWDFTVASQRNLSERILRMRDDAFARLGDASPRFLVTDVKDDVDPKTAREVRGVVFAPSYMNQYGGPPGSTFNYGRDGLPARLPGNDQAVPFRCVIPRSAFDRPARPTLYGHGLLRDEHEVATPQVRDMTSEHGRVYCASRWIGMSQEDLPNIFSVLTDLSRFPTIADRMQQGLLNFMFLGRAMRRGFTGHKAFQNDAGKPLIDTTADLGFDGNSQGGIVGGALTAVSPDVRRSVLGVTGMNFSTLLNRSTDFVNYNRILNLFYPDKLDQQILLPLIQMLWDRGESNGYAQHMTDSPLPGTPSHRVLLHVAYGDHQVAPVTAEVQARTIGARLLTPALRPGRSTDRVPFWAIPPIESTPYPGSALVMWDSGAPPLPLTNTPPTTGRDPHGDIVADSVARRQKAIFLATGDVADVCDGAPCTITPQR